MSKKYKSTHYLAVWDMLGLECLFNVDAAKKEVEEWEKGKIWATLQGEDHNKRRPNPIPLQVLLLRARVNSHRAYEIYEFDSTLTEEELREAFENDPQPVVDWIRKNGIKIYSDYVKSNSKLIV